VQQLRGESGDIPAHQLKAPIPETMVTEPQGSVSQKSGVEDSLDSSTRLLTPEPIPEPSDGMPETVVVGGETAGNSTHEATPDYDSDIIVVDIGEVSSETGDLGLHEHTRPTQEAQRASPPLDQARDDPTTASAKLKRMYNKKLYERARSSRRLQGKKPEGDDGGAGGSSVSSVFAVTSEALLATLISADPAWAVPEHIESFFTHVWPSQEKVF